jgi:cyanophycin synthetase
VDISFIFNIELLGLDLICSDISIPLGESGGAINEINTTPGLHHHDLVARQTKKYHIGSQILEHLFLNKKTCKSLMIE